MSFAHGELLETDALGAVEESFIVGDGRVERTVTDRRGATHATVLPTRRRTEPFIAFQQSWLTQTARPVAAGAPMAVVDLFSGCGGLSLGVDEAARAIGRSVDIELAVDFNVRALDVFAANFAPRWAHPGGVYDLADGRPGDELTGAERRLRRRLGGIDLLVGGPPCQGNSDLNNHTRRDDQKNALYLTMARVAEVLRPAAVLIENVPGVVHDRSGVVGRTAQALTACGYHVSMGVLQADLLGAAQRRKRHFTLARLDGVPAVGNIAATCARPPMTVDEVIGDLRDIRGESAFDTSASHSAENQARMEYLFQADLYDLPDEWRPDCHRLKKHTYRSVYGRMRGDRPAQTITSGFGSTGQGRFVHPHEPRTLTPHEAARIQGFPDFFRFDPGEGRTALQEMIGNAVPSRLAYSAALALLG